MSIETINIHKTTSDTLAVTDSDIRTVVQNDISGNWWYLFSKDNLLLYPRRTIQSDILEQFPSIKSVSVTADGFNTLNINITERDPYGIACNDAGDNNCYYIDAHGYAYESAPSFSPGVYVEYIVVPAIVDESVEKSVKQVELGKSLTDAGHLAVAKQALDYFFQMNLYPVQAAIADNGDYSIYIKNSHATSTVASSTVATTSATKIYFNTNIPLATTLEYFSKFWQSRPNKNFSYVDLRFGKDIIFKMQ